MCSMTELYQNVKRNKSRKREENEGERERECVW